MKYFYDYFNILSLGTILLRISAFVFIKGIGWLSFFPCGVLVCIWYLVMLVLSSEFGSVSYSSIVWKSLKRTGISFSWNVCRIHQWSYLVLNFCLLRGLWLLFQSPNLEKSLRDFLFVCFFSLRVNCSMCTYRGFPRGWSGKESTWQCRRQRRHKFDSWVRKSEHIYLYIWCVHGMREVQRPSVSAFCPFSLHLLHGLNSLDHIENVKFESAIKKGSFGGSVRTCLQSRRLPAMQEMRIQPQGCKDPLENKMATHSSILA